MGISVSFLCEGDELQNSGDPKGEANEMQNSQIAAWDFPIHNQTFEGTGD